MMAQCGVTFAKMRWEIAQWFEKQWWLRYLKPKNPADYLEWKRAYWLDFLAKISVEPQGDILDAGCGPAGMFISLKDFNVVATDPLLKFYANKLPHFNPIKYPNVSFHSHLLEDSDFKNQFDQIFCINVINHVNSITDSLHRMHEASRENGLLVITTDCHRNTMWKSFLTLLPFDILHPHQLSRSDYADALSTSGWKIEKSIMLKRAFIFDYYAFVCCKN